MVNEVTKQEIDEGFRHLGIAEGDTVLMHTAMRTIGRIEGGADTVVDALLEVLGKRGTLVVPTFTFAHEGEEDPIIDPASDPSEMGAITEAVRRRPEALRSTAYRHSFAAIGRRAEVITQVDPANSAFDLRSCFGVMLALGTQVIMLGLTYASSTSHHFAEFLCNVPYRHTIDITVKVRRADGTVYEQPMVDYQPKPEGGSYYGSRYPDFSRLGRMIEDRGRVGLAAIGNSAVRRFRMRDLADLAQEEAHKDYNIFRTPEGKTDFMTPLDFGTVITSPELLDGAGRGGRHKWCVIDPAKLEMPS